VTPLFSFFQYGPRFFLSLHPYSPLAGLQGFFPGPLSVFNFSTVLCGVKSLPFPSNPFVFFFFVFFLGLPLPFFFDQSWFLFYSFFFPVPFFPFGLLRLVLVFSFFHLNILPGI